MRINLETSKGKKSTRNYIWFRILSLHYLYNQLTPNQFIGDPYGDH